MKRVIAFSACALVMAGFASWMVKPQSAVGAAGVVGAPQYGSDGKLVRPVGYRKWAYLSSGYGMSYSDNPTSDGHLMFTNVFVTPSSYDYFVQHGTWPDKTVFVLEEYGSSSKGSINKHGNFQSEFMGLDVEVKDEKRFEDKWAYFGFDTTQLSSAANTPSKNGCWNCHDQHAAVEHSFVQFYPELLKVAKEKSTIKQNVHLE
jgi:hypothetical protein